MNSLKTKRTTLKRLAGRGNHDPQTIHQILDEALICHVGYLLNNVPMVIPTIHGRVGSTLYLHGSIGSQMLRSSLKEMDICITATLVDGIVLARSLFNHSMNYRSALIIGKGILVEDVAEMEIALEAISEHVVKGRWNDARKPNEKEWKQTMVVKVSIAEGSAKIRQGPPGDEEDDMDLNVWAGTIPIETTFGTPVASPDLKQGIPLPEYLQ